MTDPMTGRVILIDDEDALRHAAAQSFELADLPCATFERGADALGALSRDFDGAVVTDIRMPGMDGLEVLARSLAIDPEIPVILLTGHGDVELAVRSIRSGAWDFLEKPCDPGRLVDCVRRALATRRLVLENRALRGQVTGGDALEARLVGPGPAMSAVRAAIRGVAGTDADVLIEGETGTGKEVAARLLHRQSARADGPFVLLNCAALPEALVESELFGHEAGAFPGALRARYGKVEHAQRGTLCLDEIDSLPLGQQGKLLHALQNRAITRLGSNEPIALDIRVIAVAKDDLAAKVAAGAFRADLYYRLAVARLALPPLEARREDIPHLFAALLAQAAARRGGTPPPVPPAVLHALAARDWPGNVRELGNAAERFLLGLDLDLPDPAPEGTLADRMAAHERGLIAAAMAAHGGRLKDVYESLGLSRKTLYEKMRRHGLDREDFFDEG